MARAPETWFTSDTHFGHARILQYTQRPWATHEEMDEAILENFNKVLRPGDTLYHLGDLAWSSFPVEKFTKRLNTKQLHLILGNHDGRSEEAYRKAGFVWVGLMKSVRVGNQHAVLCHYPMRSWPAKGRGTYHLYGHCHGTVPGLDRSMDVGVDTNSYRPYAWEEVHQRLRVLPCFEDSERGSTTQAPVVLPA